MSFQPAGLYGGSSGAQNGTSFVLYTQVAGPIHPGTAIADGGEPGWNGVDVDLLDSTGATLQATTTAGIGIYGSSLTLQDLSATCP